MFCVEAILVFSLTGQVNAKKGESMYTKESAFLMVWLKKQKIKYISTYENEASWAGLFGLGIELQMDLTGQLHKTRNRRYIQGTALVLLLPEKKLMNVQVV